MRVARDITELIGRTPIVRLNRVVSEDVGEVFLKLESFNPGGSVKDRPALNMISQAEKAGLLKKDSVIVEPTSGNTGIGLAMVSAVKGYRCIIVLPETASQERVKLLKAYGATVVQTPGEKGMIGAVEKAKELAAELKAFMPCQFDNPHNPEAHRTSTAVEILEQMDGQIDGFVSSAGTGGTITGTGEVLRQAIPGIHIAVVEPAASPVLSGGQPGCHKIPGMGPGFIPSVLNQRIYDEIIQVTDEQAWETTRRLAREEGLLCGPSTGAVVFGALKLATKLGRGKRIVGIAPDTGERYLSTGVFDV